MAKYTINDTTLVAIADAIREKIGTTGGIDPANMAALIEGIQTGSDPVIEPLTVTENGTYEAPEGVDGYNPVTVNVAGSGGDDVNVIDSVADGTCTEVTLSQNCKKIRAFCFAFCNRLTKINMPDTIKEIGNNAFDGCYSLELTTLPAGLIVIGSNVFQWCYSVKSITFKSKPENLLYSAFQNSSITTINVPWAEGEVANAPWGATNATINYNYTGG